MPQSVGSTHPHPPRPDASPEARTPEPGLPESTNRREVRLFLGVTFGLAAVSMALARLSGVDVRHPNEAPVYGQLALYGTACWPLVAALLARRITVGRLRHTGLGFRRAGVRWFGTAWLLAVVVTVAGFAPVWLFGLGGWDPHHLADSIGLGSSVALGAPLAGLLGLTVGLVPWVLLAIGEEVGWRGLLVPRLAERGWSDTRISLYTGIAWATFHVPLLLLVPGAAEVNVAFATTVFAIGVIGLAFPATSLRLRTGSVWPVVVFHAVGNASLYFLCEPLTRDTGETDWYAGETGAITVAVGFVVYLLVWRRLRRA
jgi:membrane protease YdiL (CAAX protease family)